MVHDESFFPRLLLGGEDGAGDAYMDGCWSSPDLVAVVRLAILNLDQLQRGTRTISWASRLFNRLLHVSRSSSIARSRQNICKHYDLNNDFFRTFLDDRMVYSSAIFKGTETLEQAQLEKIDRLCGKLRLRAGDEVLEIGTGWGAFALRAAEKYGCRVTTTTISREQFEYSRELFARSNCQINLLHEDYRNLKGRFDHLVSIEMFEAVGLDHYDDFFGACDQLLRNNAAMAMQTITMNEHTFPAYSKSCDWIQRRIFPGSELSSVRAILSSLVRSSKLALFGLEDIGMHYAETLFEWRRRFVERRDEVLNLGFDGRFLRMWEYYLAYCEAAFRERHVSNVQLLLVKKGSRLVRDMRQITMAGSLQGGDQVT